MTISTTLARAEQAFGQSTSTTAAAAILRDLQEVYSLMQARDAADQHEHLTVHGGMGSPYAGRNATRRIETLLMGRYVEAFTRRVTELST